MEDESLCFIRDNTRSLVNLKRRNNRYHESDKRRSIPTSSIDRKTIADICNKLKTKCTVTVEELKKLKQSLLDDAENVNVVLGTHGAIRGLVRELSGHDISKQLEAAGCCCNLSLADERSCLVVGKAAAAYLVVSLDSLSSELAVTCVWSIGNLAASGSKVCQVLAAQGAISKLLTVLNTSSGDDDLSDAVIYALDHLVYQLKGDLRLDYLQNLMQVLSKSAITLSSSRILFTLSCHPSFTNNMIDQVFLQKLLEHLSVSTKTHYQCHRKKNCCDFIFLVRLLANMCTETCMCDLVFNYCTNSELGADLKNVLLLNNAIINKSVMWLLGNLLNCASDSMQKNKLYNTMSKAFL